MWKIFHLHRLLRHQISLISFYQNLIDFSFIISPDKTGINASFQKFPKDHITWCIYHIQLNFRILSCKIQKSIRKFMLHIGIGSPEFHTVLFFFSKFGKSFFNLVIQCKNFLGLYCQILSLFCKFQSMRSTFHDLYLKLCFHMFDSFCQRRLCHLKKSCYFCHAWIFMKFIQNCPIGIFHLFSPIF